MRPECFAILKWAALENGTAFLPHSLQYVALSRFPDDGPECSDDSRRIICRFETPPSEGPGTSQARVAFVGEDAPHDRLQPGRHFELFEGPRQVATVEVLW